MGEQITVFRAEVFLSRILRNALHKEASPFFGSGGNIARTIINDILANGVEAEDEDLEGLILSIARIRGYDAYTNGICRGISATCPGPVECLAATEILRLCSTALPENTVIELYRRYERPSCTEPCGVNSDPELRLRPEDYTPIERPISDEHVPVNLR